MSNSSRILKFTNQTSISSECLVCLRKYQKKSIKKCYLECGHALCNECFERIVIYTKKCPVCRTIHTLGAETSLLHQAVKNGNYDLVKKMLKKNANPNIILGENDESLLSIAIIEIEDSILSLRMVKLLLNHGANLNLTSKFGGVPLHVAVDKNNLSIVKLLLENKAKTNISDEDNIYPLHLAVEKQNINIIRLLLRYGAKKNVINYDNKTPLDIAIELENNPIINLLKKTKKTKTKKPKKTNISNLFNRFKPNTIRPENMNRVLNTFETEIYN